MHSRRTTPVQRQGWLQMLAFDDEFRLTSSRNCCALWADEPTFKRVRFSVNTQILSNRPKGSNPLHEFAELELCERERDQIEAACRRAFADRASPDIELRPTDFQRH
jgi:hypothetical protein